MHRVTVAFLIILTVCLHADEYRFQCMGAVTGLCDHVYNKDGEKTAIKIDFANREAAEVFLALQKKRIYGTQDFEDHMGVRWEQGIILIGDFTSEVKHTPAGPNTAASEPYRDFRCTGIKIKFPVWRFQEAVADQVDPPVFLETHFSFDSLFPQGLAVNGKPIDLSRHSADPKQSQQE